MKKTQHSIDDTHVFPNMSSSIPHLQDDEEDASHDVMSLFTNILIEETISYTIEKIYVQYLLQNVLLNSIIAF